MTTVLRRAREEDAPTLLALVHAGFEQYRGRLDPPSGAHNDTLETVRHKLSQGGAVLALVDQANAGCVFYEPRIDYVYLGRLAVLPTYQRHGVGRALVAEVENEARTLGFTRVRLGVRLALPENQAFFERSGYRVLDYAGHAGYAQPTFVNLEKDISL